jgi:hypothetical protein
MENRKIPPRALAVWVILGFLALSSCGSRKIGYGVLLWSPDDVVVENGAVFPIYEESRLRRTYIIPWPSPDAPEERVEIAVWRVRFFPAEEEAETFAADFAGIKDLYARTERNALPIREKADRLSRQVYRLRLNETVKILELSTVPSDENGLMGYWYKVLTMEGETGYCFNYYLSLYNSKTDGAVSSSQDPSQEAIEKILAYSWRPAYFQDMVKAGRIDLARFHSSYGLFFDDEPRQIRVVLPTVSTLIPFAQISKTTGDTYIVDGGDARMTLRANGAELALSYSARNAGRRNDVFIVFDQDVEKIIAQEQERRHNLLKTFLRGGKNFHSSAYGEIIFTDTGTEDFTWTGFNRLVPGVIPPGTSNTGKVEFSVFIAQEVRDSYDGVVTFHFTGGAEGISFFYRFTAQGTQLIHIPPEDINENIVRRKALNPLVLFFTRS